MKLRNKKTGDIIESEYMMLVQITSNKGERNLLFEDLAQFNEEWEDYKPAEPYIEDYKKRKLVRDWAEINDIKTVLVCQTFNAWGFKNKPDGEPGDKEYMSADILFKGEKPEELEFGKEYAIFELCEKGEE